MTGRSSWAADPGPAVSSVGSPGRSARVFDEDLAVEIGDDNLGAVGNGEDAVEAVRAADSCI